jgi:hypothetical protein
VRRAISATVDEYAFAVFSTSPWTMRFIARVCRRLINVLVESFMVISYRVDSRTPRGVSFRPRNSSAGLAITFFEVDPILWEIELEELFVGFGFLFEEKEVVVRSNLHHPEVTVGVNRNDLFVVVEGDRDPSFDRELGGLTEFPFDNLAVLDIA